MPRAGRAGSRIFSRPRNQAEASAAGCASGKAPFGEWGFMMSAALLAARYHTSTVNWARQKCAGGRVRRCGRRRRGTDSEGPPCPVDRNEDRIARQTRKDRRTCARREAGQGIWATRLAWSGVRMAIGPATRGDGPLVSGRGRIHLRGAPSLPSMRNLAGGGPPPNFAHLIGPGPDRRRCRGMLDREP